MAVKKAKEPSEKKYIHAKDGEEFRAWLEENYKTEKEVYLCFYKLSAGKPTISWEKAVDEALCFGWIDGIRNKVNEEEYSTRFTPRKPGSIWSLINKNKVEKLIGEGKMKPEGLAIYEEAREKGSLDNPYTLSGKTELPAEMKAALKKDKKAWEFFQKLANSNQFMYIHQVTKIKSEELRKERIDKVVELCRRGVRNYSLTKPLPVRTSEE
jgi:uncharacterized protein YdeI (YjbR/CyaY-like superfamily)